MLGRRLGSALLSDGTIERFMFRFVVFTVLMAVTLWSAEKAPAKKSAFDKPTLEAYVRHLFVWGPTIKVELGEPKPSPLAGFDEILVHASAGEASADETLYVSKDGQKIVRGSFFEIDKNPFKEQLDKLHTQLQPSFGTPGAPVVIVLFSDFECPYCKEEAKSLRSNLVSTYPKEVQAVLQGSSARADSPLGHACGDCRPVHLQAESGRFLGLS